MGGEERAMEDNCATCCVGWKKVATNRATGQLERRRLTGWGLGLHSKEVGFYFVVMGRYRRVTFSD